MAYAVAFLVLGFALSGTAFALGGLWHAAHWFTLSCIALVAGYAGAGPGVFGKRSDGRLPAWSRALHFPFLAYAGLVWHLARLVACENALDRVDDGLWIGRRLLPGEFPAGIDQVVDLTCEADESPEVLARARYIPLPILDGAAPSRDALDRALDATGPGSVFVHCAQGHGRTGLFALALLARRGQISTYEEGLARLRSARPGVGLSGAQEAFLRAYLEARFAPPGDGEAGAPADRS